jgi:hypothetical protein
MEWNQMNAAKLLTAMITYIVLFVFGVYVGMVTPKPPPVDTHKLPLSLLAVKSYNIDGSWSSKSTAHLSVDVNGVTHGVAALVHKGETITVYVELLPEVKPAKKIILGGQVRSNGVKDNHYGGVLEKGLIHGVFLPPDSEGRTPVVIENKLNSDGTGHMIIGYGSKEPYLNRGGK